MAIRTLDDLVAADRRLALRLDINSPLINDDLADDARIKAHLETLTELSTAGAQIAILAHQGRPGSNSFRSLESHADRLDDLVDAPVSFTDSTFTATARREIESLKSGSILVLENTRFYSEEYIEFEPARAATTYLVTRLTPVLDGYVNDAFAAAHRSQPSLVGFPEVLPSYAGRLMERELDVLGNIDETERPRVYFLAGAKVPDSLSVAEAVLDCGLADEVLTAGLFGNILLHATGTELGEPSIEILRKFDALKYESRAQSLLESYPDQIYLPDDLAIHQNDERVEIPIEDLPADGPALDIGTQTVDTYTDRFAAANTSILNGPAGRVEDPEFTAGTRGVYESAAKTKCSIVGGGDTGAVLRRLGINGFDHVSTGGGAAMQMLAGESLPAVDVLDDGN